MDLITVHDKQFTPFISPEEIAQRIGEVASEIHRDYSERNPIFLSVLNGSFIFAADLLRAIDFPAEISFVKLASYQGTATTGAVRRLTGLDESLRGRHVIIVEDIVDSGITMEALQEDLRMMEPASVRITTLLFKPDAFKKSFPIDYTCFTIPDKFVVGYGLDYNGHGRNYPGIYSLLQ